MDQQNHNILRSSWKELVFFSVLGGILALGLSLLRPLEYSSTGRLLIVQKVAPIDAYSAIKSVETISENLAEIIYTTSFFDRVLDTDIRIQKNFFSNNERTRRKQWEKMVDTHAGRGSGFLNVTVYHPDKREARKIVEAISQVLITQAWEYINADIQIRSVDSPLESRFPVRPNLVMNGLAGAVMGFLLGSVYALNTRKRVPEKKIAVLRPESSIVD